ncbi:MAG: aminopeptidase N [Burkholderiaceae bacterium]|nr:aminopeptidase N [Burkholderiaceae bacterium]
MTVHRTAYTPPPWLVDDVRLVFDLDPRSTLVRASLSVRRNPQAGADASTALVLDGEQLEPLELRVDGRLLEPAEYRVDEHTLTIDRVPERFELGSVARVDPQANTALSGLYVSNGGFFTQCEAQGFRRITWFPDRPDVMARYTVTLRAPRQTCPVLLSNGNLVDAGSGAPSDAGGAVAPDEWHWATWHDPFPKPSYLFAVVAARLAAIERRLRTASGREVLLQVWVEPGNEARAGHAMDSLERAIRWDEQRFGRELDLDRFMIVAVSDFNMGAMENKGLNIFNAKYVFADPHIATDNDFAAVESVVGHEYFHNWTGNRVTCRDWFQLTLKEGLTVFRDQEFSADMLAERSAGAGAASARAVKRIEDVRVLRSAQFAEDAGPMAHPIRPDAYEEIDNFYTVTVYEKGAEVIRMLQTLAGRDGFRRGLDLYFARHDGQAVTCDEFVSAIGDANGQAFTQFRRWYSQAGTPRVQARGRYDAAARSYTLELEQRTPPTPGQPLKLPLHIPFAIGLVGRDDGRDRPLRIAELVDGRMQPVKARAGQTGEHTAVLDLTEARHVFVFDDLDAEPLPSLARDFSAPIVVEHDYDDDALALLAAHDSDPFNRWEALQRSIVASILAVLAGAEVQQRCAPLVKTVGALLRDDTLDPAFREQLFTLPSEGFVAEQLDVVDPAALREARNAVRRCLADALAAAWRDTWAACKDHAAYSPDAVCAGRRALKNVSLAYWVDTQAREAIDAAVAQFDAADNMTDAIGALQALLRTPGAPRDDALARFAARHAGEALVLDKWFALQATMHRQPGDAPVLDRVRELMRHPAFSMRNPNRLRALVGSFCNGNLAEFHAADGSGYDFWVERVLEADALNPQIAARLARALDRWRKFEPGRQALMRASLERVAQHPPLSNDVREIVEKALA